MKFRSLERDFHSIKSLELLEYSTKHKLDTPSEENWADYAFLAACFMTNYGDNQLARDIAEEIKSIFPGYDPLRRFSWSAVVDNTESNELLYKKFDFMILFRNNNPTFKFENLFGDLFPFD